MLTDQAVIAGIGNAYSDEILHAARLSPFALTDRLSDEQVARSTRPRAESCATRWRVRWASARHASRRRSAPAWPCTAGPGCRARCAGDTVRQVSFADLQPPVLSRMSDRRQAAGRPPAVPARPVTAGRDSVSTMTTSLHRPAPTMFRRDTRRGRERRSRASRRQLRDHPSRDLHPTNGYRGTRGGVAGHGSPGGTGRTSRHCCCWTSARDLSQPDRDRRTRQADAGFTCHSRGWVLLTPWRTAAAADLGARAVGATARTTGGTWAGTEEFKRVFRAALVVVAPGSFTAFGTKTDLSRISVGGRDAGGTRYILIGGQVARRVLHVAPPRGHAAHRTLLVGPCRGAGGRTGGRPHPGRRPGPGRHPHHRRVRAARQPSPAAGVRRARHPLAGAGAARRHDRGLRVGQRRARRVAPARLAPGGHRGGPGGGPAVDRHRRATGAHPPDRRAPAAPRRGADAVRGGVAGQER